MSINRNSTNKLVDEVTCDGKKNAITAVEYLIKLGHSDIAYVGECHGETRYKEYVDTLMRHDLELNPSYIFETKQAEAAGFDIMEKILGLEDTPTAIYCANDITAIGMLKAKAKCKYLNISIISSDDIEQAQFTKPMLTTVALPKIEMARFAVYLLIDRIKGRHNTVTTMELEGKMIVRESCVNLEDSSWNYFI